MAPTVPLCNAAGMNTADSTTVMAKPGSDVYKFLARQRGRKVKIVLSEAGGTELSRLER